MNQKPTNFDIREKLALIDKALADTQLTIAETQLTQKTKTYKLVRLCDDRHLRDGRDYYRDRYCQAMAGVKAQKAARPGRPPSPDSKTQAEHDAAYRAKTLRLTASLKRDEWEHLVNASMRRHKVASFTELAKILLSQDQTVRS